MNNRSRSTLFLIEQLIVIAVFALCASACVRILTSAFFMARDSKDMSNAILAAENGAESYKAASGDVGLVAEMLGGISASIDESDAAIVYFDKQWQVCGEDLAFYKLCLVSGKSEEQRPPILSGELSVEKLTGEELIAFTVAARGLWDE